MIHKTPPNIPSVLQIGLSKGRSVLQSITELTSSTQIKEERKAMVCILAYSHHMGVLFLGVYENVVGLSQSEYAFSHLPELPFKAYSTSPFEFPAPGFFDLSLSKEFFALRLLIRSLKSCYISQNQSNSISQALPKLLPQGEGQTEVCKYLIEELNLDVNTKED
ncbi:hypothetical protein E3N88_31272 [Mikania micrantha]|uniref:Uncharacterized protein n=1 Tax=Mikania micrantha TaxID=192012 RepID=A0A5N6MPK2_9ASTR|nr:hypothetical protein E3N88_31272 [Mikania micrantha]